LLLRRRPTWIALALAGAFTVGTMSLTNFRLGSDFRWLLLPPVLLWLLGLLGLAAARMDDSTAA
jgi:hypothetical protein